MATDLGGSQISTLLETLPGIANVLRSPVADALINVIRAGARLGEFNLSDAEELIHYAVRRSLVAPTEGDQVLEEVRESVRKRAERAAERAKPAKGKSKAGARAKATRSKAKPRAKSKAAGSKSKSKKR
ncbi:MAG: hypothetical protein AB7I33_09460 [Gemmatimonadales bacterium]